MTLLLVAIGGAAGALARFLVDGAIVGFRRADQVDPIVGAANLDLDAEDVATIDGER